MKGFKLSPDEVDQAGSHMQDLGSKLDTHATNIASTHQKISASSRSDKSSVGKMFTSFASKSGAAFSDGFKQLSRVSKGAGDRLKTGSKQSKQTESDVQNSFTKIQSSSAEGKKPAPKPKPNTQEQTQNKINDHQGKADSNKTDAASTWASDEEKLRFGKSGDYHQNAADNYKNGRPDLGDNNAAAAKFQDQANDLHFEDSAGKQKQHQMQAADHYEQAAQHAANGHTNAASSHVDAAGHHLQAADLTGKKQYGAADRHQVAGRHDGLAADHLNEASTLSPHDPAAKEHTAAAMNHHQAANHFANNKPAQGHAAAAQANTHAANAYGQQGNQAMADHHAGLATNHQNASDHLTQANQHQQADNKTGDSQQQQDMWKQQQLAAHQNGIAHNTHQQVVSQNAGNTEQANHHAQAVTHHQQQQQAVENHQPTPAPTHTPADPHTATSVPYQAPASQPHVYRWDDRPPANVFGHDMQPQESSSSHSLYTHTMGNTPTHYLSTSSNPTFQWDKQNRYVLTPPSGSLDANATLGTHSPYPHQSEAAVPGPISSGHFVAGENPVTGEVEFPKRKGTL
jgi:hypothetical protein